MGAAGEAILRKKIAYLTGVVQAAHALIAVACARQLQHPEKFLKEQYDEAWLQYGQWLNGIASEE